MSPVPTSPPAPRRREGSRRGRCGRLVASSALLSLVVGLPLAAAPAWATPYTYDLQLFAGTGAAGTPAAPGGQALSGPISTPAGQAVDASGNHYVADVANHVVHKVTPAGVSSVFAGDGTQGPTVAGTATGVHLDTPVGLAVGRSGELYIADPAQRKVFAVDTSGNLTVVAGNGSQGNPSTSAAPTSSPFQRPTSLAVDDRTLYIVDQDANQVLSMSTQNLSTPMVVAVGTGTRGTPSFGNALNGAPPATAMGRITGIAAAGGKKWITDDTSCYVMFIDGAGNSSALAGNGTCAAPTLGGSPTSSSLTGPAGITRDGNDTPYFTDGTKVLSIDTSRLVAIAGNGSSGAPAAGPALQSPFTSPGGIVASSGSAASVYVSDPGAHRVVRLVPRVSPNINGFMPPPPAQVGTATSHTFQLSAGSAPVTWSVASGTLPPGLALDPATGTVSGTPTTPGGYTYGVRAANSAGTSTLVFTQRVLGTYALSVVAGTGAGVTPGTPVPGAASSSPLGGPAQPAVDRSGNVYLADAMSATVLKITPSGQLSTVSTGSVTLQSVAAVAVDSAGDLYIADTTGSQVVLVPASGSPVQLVGAPATAALNTPVALAVQGAGSSATVYIADRGAHKVLAYSRSTSALSTYAGDGTQGTIANDRLDSPSALAVDAQGTVYIADANNRVVVTYDALNPAGSKFTPVVGTGAMGAMTDGPAASRTVGMPSGLAVDASGSLFVTDGRLVAQVYDSSSGKQLVVIGGNASAPPGTPTAGLALQSPMRATSGVAVSSAGRVYVTDQTSNRLVVLEPQQLAAITSAAPPAATSGTAFTHTFTATGTGPLSWSVTSGSLPAGLTLNASTGVLSGTPTAAGSATFTVGATNLAGVGTQAVTLTVSAAPAGGGGGGASTPPPVTASIPPGVARVQGADRTATAVSVSAQLFPTAGTARGAVVATDATFADGIGGAGLAASLGGPMLFTGKDSLDAATKAEIARTVKPGGTVYVLGGTAAVSEAVVDQLKALGGYTVTRLGGADRYATSVMIADVVGPRTGSSTPPVYLASGTNYPDALTVASLAAHRDGVVLLTAGPKMPAATDAWLDAHDAGGAGRTTTVGGPATAALPGAKDSLVGADRYATSALVAKEFGDKAGSVGVASGTSWPDALVGSAAMGIVDGPLLLTNPGSLSSATSGYLGGASSVKGAWLFGGEQAVSPATETSLRGLLPKG